MKYFVLSLYLLFLFLASSAQDSFNYLKTHNIKLGVGVGFSDYFSGYGGSLSYEYHPSRKYFMSAAFTGTEEFMLFGGEAETIQEFSVLFNKILFSKKIEGSVGAGVSYVKHYLESKHFLVPPPGTYPPDYRLVHTGKIGLPVNLQISTNKQRGIVTALSAHANFNSINKFCLFQLHVGYSF